MDKNILIQWAIAKVIREARNALDISQVQLADFSGLSYPFISDVERGNVGVSIAALLQIAEVLKVEASELMRRIDEGAEALDAAVKETPLDSQLGRALFSRDEIMTRMEALRTPVDEAELIAGAKDWPFPTYSELLFSVM